MSVTTAGQELLVTKDGTPLKQSLAKANAKRRRTAFLLVLPLILISVTIAA